MLEHNFQYLTFLFIFLIGLYGVLAKKNLIKKLISLAIFQSSVLILFIASGVKQDGNLPILFENSNPNVIYNNPLPHVLMLTAIVVGVALLGLGLALIQKIYHDFETIEEDKISDV